jgi:hypothetical protein
MYQSVCDVYDHHWISKWVPKSVSLKKDSLEITTVRWQKMIVVWRVMPVTQKKEEVRTQSAKKIDEK